VPRTLPDFEDTAANLVGISKKITLTLNVILKYHWNSVMYFVALVIFFTELRFNCWRHQIPQDYIYNILTLHWLLKIWFTLTEWNKKQPSFHNKRMILYFENKYPHLPKAANMCGPNLVNIPTFYSLDNTWFFITCSLAPQHFLSEIESM
jgi:hypothetical protein